MIAVLNTQLHKQTPERIRIIRFTIGVTLAIAIAFGFDWPLAFIAAVFTANFLGNNSPKLPFKALFGILIVSITAFCAGILVTRFLLPFPIVFILIMTLLIFLVSYWGYSGGNDFVITMLLVGFTLVPMLGLFKQEVASVVTIGFLFSCLIALLITMIMHEIIPDNPNTEYEDKVEKQGLKLKSTRFQLALLSTIIIMPAIVFFMFFGLTSSLLILVFIAILAQKPDLLMGMKGSKALLLGNTIGGLAAIAVYKLLLIAPTFTALVLLFAVVNIYFAKLIFSDNPLAPLFAMALTTMIILISSGSSGDAGAGGKFYIRILQIGAACGYIIFATYLTTPLLTQIKSAYKAKT
ncbi:DUF2955 domain-containing protein [Thalassotalea psychrophila]|uniref:DUF2955 domain-containing protein n=1 Tax=Thalassotalea psychrophila TaxID=3065647 RepID=A0ABY9TWW1_9GAMM|nr:DUF2955 domain-containing protein [Colwelliaceae bacterium SQ149]